MKRVIAVLAVIMLVIWAGGCKKCYRCYNQCIQCSLTDSTGTYTHVLCTDSFSSASTYQAAFSADTAAGYTCGSTASTYDYSFCVNQPGSDPYQNYYNKGQRVTCDEK